MPKFKVTATKNQKKYSFVVTADFEREAKERIHEKGYSILGVEIFNEQELNGRTIYFKAKNNKGEEKSGKVVGNDIFKIYLKLVEGLKYEVLEIYPDEDKNKNKEYKQKITKELFEQYNLFRSNKKEKKQEEKQEENIKDSFYLKKQLEETYKLIDFVLEKLKNLFENKEINIDNDKKEKLKKLHNSLIKLKSSTNIIKLKEVGEKVLLKVGEIELEYLEENKNVEISEELNNTNNLLKQLGSKKKFIESDKDYLKKIGNFLNETKRVFHKEEKKHEEKDGRTYSAMKTKLLLNKYNQKLKENTKEILKYFYIFIFPLKKFEEKKNDLLIKNQVLKQNIYLFKAKLEKGNFSYTKTLKGVGYFFDSLFETFISLRNYLFLGIFLYSIIFLIIIILNYYGIININNIMNYKGILYFIMFILLYLAIYFSRGIFTLFINFTILFFICAFGFINF